MHVPPRVLSEELCCRRREPAFDRLLRLGGLDAPPTGQSSALQLISPKLRENTPWFSNNAAHPSRSPISAPAASASSGTSSGISHASDPSPGFSFWQSIAVYSVLSS